MIKFRFTIKETSNEIDTSRLEFQVLNVTEFNLLKLDKCKNNFLTRPKFNIIIKDNGVDEIETDV